MATFGESLKAKVLVAFAGAAAIVAIGYGVTRPGFQEAVAEQQRQADEQTISVIEDNNFRDVRLGDANYIYCGKGEIGTEFQAKNMTGRVVRGVACSQPLGLKGTVLRYPSNFFGQFNPR